MPENLARGSLNIVTRSVYALNDANELLGNNGVRLRDLLPEKRQDFTDANPNNPRRPGESPDFYVPEARSYANKGKIMYKADNSKSLNFQFNPSELSGSYTPIYENRPKTGYDNLDYFWVGGEANTLSFTLFLDATEGSRQKYMGLDGGDTISEREMFTHNPDRGVLNQTEFFLSLLRPYIPSDNTPIFVRGSSRKHKQFYPPPEIIFIWGTWYLEGICLTAMPTYLLHNKNLVPVRATIDVTLRLSDGIDVNLLR